VPGPDLGDILRLAIAAADPAAIGKNNRKPIRFGVGSRREPKRNRPGKSQPQK
jgi:hypothetical protein